jgi:tetratricopeptide (TPR) repeat protein
MKRPINNTAAYNMWILAKNEFNKLSSAGIERGIVLTKKALEIEGENAQLYATLAYMYWAYYDFGIKHDAEVFEFMEQYVLKSLSLDPDNAEALSSKGLILYKKGDLPGYIRYARPAADMGGDTVFLFSFILAELGKLEEADVYADWAMASNPLIYMALWARACVDMFMGKIAEGYNLLSDARNRLAPGEPFVGWWVGQLAWYAGDNATAYEEFKKGAESGSSPWQEFCNLNKLAMDSDIKGVSEQIQTSGIVEFSITDEFYPICIANTLVITGEFDEALKWLDRSVSWGFSNYKFLSEYNRFLEPLRNDSRFKKIIEKARLQQLNFTGL